MSRIVLGIAAFAACVAAYWPASGLDGNADYYAAGDGELVCGWMFAPPECW